MERERVSRAVLSPDPTLKVNADMILN